MIPLLGADAAFSSAHARVRIAASTLELPDGTGRTLATAGADAADRGPTLGEGAFGKVATYMRYGALVAVKELKRDALETDSIGECARWTAARSFATVMAVCH